MSTFGDAAWGPYNVHNRRVRQNTILQGIEEGEAKRLSNGQWACLVCPSRPVMDTPEMLAVHRGGKKHLAHCEVYKETHNIVSTSNDKKRRRDDEDEIESEEKIQSRNSSYREPQVGPMMVPRNIKRQKILNNDGNTDTKTAENRSGFGQLPSSLSTKNNDKNTKSASDNTNNL
eukprot:TRINITY_DN15011_c0_g1_i1.p1 TRINITY_DN15011_c0_g1~~TRINITY_DN15011_c0_g1_i1.p1  ORF type:complete len:174 (-),score=14.66 TRINITY_DN15011_c0_g1_i1:23-544(-)